MNKKFIETVVEGVVKKLKENQPPPTSAEKKADRVMQRDYPELKGVEAFEKRQELIARFADDAPLKDLSYSDDDFLEEGDETWDPLDVKHRRFDIAMNPRVSSARRRLKRSAGELPADSYNRDRAEKLAAQATERPPEKKRNTGRYGNMSDADIMMYHNQGYIREARRRRRALAEGLIQDLIKGLKS